MNMSKIAELEASGDTAGLLMAISVQADLLSDPNQVMKPPKGSVLDGDPSYKSPEAQSLIKAQWKEALLDSLKKNVQPSAAGSGDRAKNMAQAVESLVAVKNFGDPLSEVGLELSAKTAATMKDMVGDLKKMDAEGETTEEEMRDTHEAIVGALGSVLAVKECCRIFLPIFTSVKDVGQEDTIWGY